MEEGWRREQRTGFVWEPGEASGGRGGRGEGKWMDSRWGLAVETAGLGVHRCGGCGKQGDQG